MATPRELMDTELKAAVVPVLRDRSFKGTLPHFRRMSPAGVDLLTFQFDRNGGGFVIEIARGSAEGFTTHWGKFIPANKLTAWDLHPNKRYRLKPREGSGTDSWFRYENANVAEVARQVLELLAKAESWWSKQVEV
jgi:hypothetical protein